MPRQRKKGSSRKHPLVFTESPVEVSRRFPSPVFAARNPIGANLVAVDEKRHFWVSPQIDPNAPHTPPRRGRARRNKTACSLDPLTQTQRCKEITRRETASHFTSLQFVRGNAGKSNSGIVAAGKQAGSDCSSDSSTESTLTSISHVGREGIQQEVQLTNKRRSPLKDIGIAGRTRAQQRRSKSKSSQNWNHLCLENVEDDSWHICTSATDKQGNNNNPCIPSGQKENCGSKNDLYEHHSTEQEILSPNDTTSPVSLIAKKRKSDRTSQKPITRDQSAVSKACGNNRKGHSVRFHQSETSSSDSQKSSGILQVMRHRKRSAISEGGDTGKDTSQGGKCGAGKASSHKESVLAYDTPEAEYGVRVSLRRRRKLLPTPARNKLMMCL